MYKLLANGEIRNLDEGVTIPPVQGNRHYAEYLEWLEAGNTPEPPDVPVLTVIQLREREYLKDGITTEALVVALWEKVVENRPESLEALQAKRLAVKAKIPKP